MSIHRTQHYCVRFMATSCYRVTLFAKSPAEAIAEAQSLWRTKGEQAFTRFEGDTDGWDAARE